MKKKIVFVLLLVLTIFINGCTTVNNEDDGSMQYQIYKLAYDSGYNGTYEDWLNSISGRDGIDGKSVEIDINDNNIVWSYVGEKEYKTIISLDGLKGTNGTNGKEVEFQVSDGFIKWHYVGENTWFNLIELSTLVGPTGASGEPGTNGTNGKEVEFQVSDGFIKWHYVGENTWFNLIELSTLVGPTGASEQNGKSAYQLYKETYSEYEKTEQEWLDDLINGRLGNIEKHQVLFFTNNDQTIEPQIVIDGKKVIKPSDPIKEGYEFVGWFNQYHEEWIFGGYSVTEDIVLTAKWKLNNYKLTINNDNGCEPQSYTIYYNDDIDISIPTKEGYVFCYYIDENNNEFTSSKYAFDKDKTLTAKWIKQSTITFNCNCDDRIDPIMINTYIINELPAPVRDGVLFLGWYYNNELLETPFKYDYNEDITIEAKWILTTGDFDYVELDEENISIYGYHGTDNVLSIPSDINNKNVVSISKEVFMNNDCIEKIVLPSSIKIVNDNAFMNCISLKEVVFNSDITTYGDNILLGCTSLEKITIDILDFSLLNFFNKDEKNIPNSFDTIELKGIERNIKTMFYDVLDHMFNIITKDFVLLPSFKDIICISSIVINEGVTIIVDGAFYNCSSLTSIVIPESVTRIGRNAFYNCSGLTSITIPERVTSIGDVAFSGCSSLTSIIIPERVTSIDVYTFYNCISLTSITIPEEVASIGYSAFSDCRSLTSITIPERVTSIENNTFSGCRSLTSITIPERVASIGNEAFSGCSSLSSIIIPERVTSIGSKAFSGCSSLTIYCKAASQPNSWSPTWNLFSSVVWGM